MVYKVRINTIYAGKAISDFTLIILNDTSEGINRGAVSYTYMLGITISRK